MAKHEGIILDHASIATNRTALDITNYIAEQGPDFGQSEFSAYEAEAAYGSVPVDGRFPKRTVTIPLGLHGRTGGDTYDQIRTKIQAKVALFQREGGHIARTNTRVGNVYAEVTNASLKLGGSSLAAYGSQDTDAVLTLECLPVWKGDEVSASPAHDETSLPELKWTETGIEGDQPGEVRLVVTERDGDDQLGLLWGFRSRHYSSASTAALAYEAEALTPMDTAAVAVLSGASGAGSNTMQHSNLGTNWTPVLNTNLLAGTYLTHTGSYRVWARVYSTSPSDTVDVDLRFVWDVGDMTNPTENAPWTFPAASNFYMADLGEIRLDPTTGTHRWQGQIQARGTAGGESCRIDRLFFQPLDEGAGKLIAPINVSQGLATLSARDEFNQSAGALTGKTAAVGGTWAGAGDADDFSVETSGATAQRTAVSDVGIDTGRYAISGVSGFASQVVQVDVKWSATPVINLPRLGVIARYTDTNNWLMATITPLSTAAGPAVRVTKRVAGTLTVLKTLIPSALSNSTFYTVRLSVDAAGRWLVWVAPSGSDIGNPVMSGQDSALATGGALATGKPGIYDAWPTTTAITRNYDNFAAWVPPTDAVAFANRTVELTSDGSRRQDSAGNAYGPVSFPTGDNPRLPVAGLEGRTTEVFLKASRGDFDQIPDAAIDDIRGQANYRASWLQLPDDTGS